MNHLRVHENEDFEKRNNDIIDKLDSLSHVINLKYSNKNSFDLEDKIIEIDQRILETNKALLEAQIVKFRSTFSNSKNFLEKIGKNVYTKKVDDSIKWYQKDLKELYLKRKQLQISLEKLKGVFWLNRIKRFVIIIT